MSGEELTNLTEGHDGLVIQVDQTFDRPLTDAIIPIPNAPISSNISRYLAEVERDLERVIGTSPQARGQVTKATAFEVQTVQMYTESEFGMHAAVKDEWLAELVKLLLRALIAAMTDRGDSRGAFEDEEIRVGEVGAILDEGQEEESAEPRSEPWTVDRIQEIAKKAGIDTSDDDFKALVKKVTDKEELSDLSDEELQMLGAALGGDEPEQELTDEEEGQAKQMLVDGISAAQTPYVDDELVRPLGVIEEGEDSITIQQDTLVLNERGENVIITVHDLDAAFDISFVEGGRTPLTDAAMQQNLVALLQPYTALWQAAQAPGADGLFAKSYMKVIAERFDLPKDLHPDELLARADEEAKVAEEEAKEAGVEPAEPPTNGAGAPGGEHPGGDDQQLQAIIGEISQLPPDQAIGELKKLFASDPKMVQMLSEREALPPAEQQRMLTQLLGAASAPV